MMIRYTDSLDGITADHLTGGFFQGWVRVMTPTLHLRTLRGANGVVLAIDTETEQVIGYITMLTDGVLVAFIASIEVLPAYQGQGIGTALFQKMLEKVAHIPNIDLMCDPDVQPFYARFGMFPLGGMAMRRHELKIAETE